MQHIFELSGLGNAPFTIIHPNNPLATNNSTYWCEHCGRTIKNRHFIKSADNNIAVVGSTCIKKTGDNGLIVGVRQLKKQIKLEEKQRKFHVQQAECEARQRALNGGLTNAELINSIESNIKLLTQQFLLTIKDHPVLKSLTKSRFEVDMQLQAFIIKPYSANQLAIIKKIHTKKVSGSRANSKAYKEAAPFAFSQVDDLQSQISCMNDQLNTLRERTRAYR